MAILYTYPEKVGNANNDDVIIIADSADSNKTKTIKVSQLPASSGAGITLTTTGTTGQAQLVGTVLNVPQYQGQLNLSTTGTGAATLVGDNLNIPTPASGLGSVGLSMPSGFTVANSPLTADGTIGVTINGGSNSTYYRGDGTWNTPTDTTYSVMGSGNSYAAGLVLAGSSTHGSEFLRKDGTWQTVTATLPLAASGTRGGIQIGYSQNAKNYPVQLDSEQAYVNVPWTDTNTTNITLTTTGSTGQATWDGTTLNIPQYAGETGWSPLPIYAGETTLGSQETGAFTQLRHATATSTLIINTVKVFLPQLINGNPGPQNDAQFAIAVYQGSLTNWYNSSGSTAPTFLGQFKYTPNPSGAVYGVKEVPIDSGTISIKAGTDYIILVSVSQNGALLLGKVGQGNFHAPRLCVGTNTDYSAGIPTPTSLPFGDIIGSNIPLDSGDFFSNFIYAMNFYYNPPS